VPEHNTEKPKKVKNVVSDALEAPAKKRKGAHLISVLIDVRN